MTMILPALHVGAHCLMHVESDVVAINSMLGCQALTYGAYGAGPFTAGEACQP